MLRKLRSRCFTALLLGAVCLVGAPTGLAVEYANVDVADDPADPVAGNNVTATILQKTANFFIDPTTNNGDYPVRIGADFTDDNANGVLMTYVRENGRSHLDSLGATEKIYTTQSSYRSTGNSGRYWIGSFRAGDVPATTNGDASQNSLWVKSAEHNANFAAAYFPFSEGWLGASVYNQSNGGILNEFVGHPSMSLANNFQQDAFGTGDNLVTIPGVTDTRRQGLLFVTGGKNEANYALSEPTAGGDGFNVTVKDNARNGSGGEVDPVSFVFMPLGTPNVTMARIFARGHSGNPNPTAMIKSGGNFTITRENPGEYRLSITGETPSSGTLLLSPSGSNDGADGANVDNIVTYRPDGNDWIILDQDGEIFTGAGQDSGFRPESYFSFAFLPFASPVTAPGPIQPVSSLTNFSRSRVIGWNSDVTVVNGTNDPGAMYIDEPEQTADVNIISLFEGRGDNGGFAVDGGFLAADDGILFATVSEGLRDNTAVGGHFDYGIASTDVTDDGEWSVRTATADPVLSPNEHSVNFSTAFFGANAGFTMAHSVNTLEDLSGAGGTPGPDHGTLDVDISGVNSLTDGVLIATGSGNDDNFVTATPRGDGSGWDLSLFDNSTDREGGGTANNVNYIYLPYDADNLVAGRVNEDGTLASSTDTGDFSLTKSADGTYLLTVNGKTPSDGMLLLTSTGDGANSADNTLVYEPAGNDFRILGLDMITVDDSSISGLFVDLEDTSFSFAYIDFDNPVALATVGLAGDFNENGIVDAADYTLWRDNEGTTNALPNDSGLGGTVGAAHYNLWVANFGNTSPSSASAVPEPGSIVLLGLALGLTGIRRRKS